jgi:hypothetical protein
MHAIKAVILMDNDGNRIISKYYDDSYSTVKEQKAFEKSLFNKTVRANCMLLLKLAAVGICCRLHFGCHQGTRFIGENNVLSHCLQRKL